MKKSLYIILICLAFSCKDEGLTIKGKLYFKIIDVVNMHGYDEEQKLRHEKFMSDLELSKSTSEDARTLVSYFRNLQRLNLESSPYIKIMDNNGKVVNVFMTESQYLKFSGFKQDSLLKSKKAVNLKLAVEKSDTDIYILKEIIDLDVVSGKTPWDK